MAWRVLWVVALLCVGQAAVCGARGGSGSSSSARSSSSSSSVTSSRTVAARNTVYGSKLSRYAGPQSSYPTGTRATYVPSTSPLFFGYTWLIIATSGAVEPYNGDDVEFDVSNPPPGCTETSLNNTTSQNVTDPGLLRNGSFWNAQVYDIDGVEFSCVPVDITSGTGESGLQAWVIFLIVFGSVILAFLHCLCCCLVMG